jgi:hypothetical protein
VIFIIFGFYTNNECQPLNDYMTKLKATIDKEPENYLEFAKNPFHNSHIIKIQNNYILSLNTIYGGMSPFLILFELIIINKYFLLYKIKKTSKTKEKIHFLNKKQIMELLICNYKN